MGYRAPNHVLFLGTPSALWAHVREWLQDAGIGFSFVTDPREIIQALRSGQVQTVFASPNPKLLKAVRDAGFEIPILFLMDGRERYGLREQLHVGAAELLNPKISETLFVTLTKKMCELGRAIHEASQEFAREPYVVRKHFGPVILQQAILSMRRKKAA